MTKIEAEIIGEDAYITSGDELANELTKFAPRRFEVYAGESHELFEPPDRPFLAIVNMDSAGGPGTHWTAIARDNGAIYYYDSLGEPPPASLARKLKQITTDIYYLDSQTQPNTSNRCGFYALDFLRRFIKNKGANVSALYGDYSEGARAAGVMNKRNRAVVN
jgi:hypothetical protein